MKALTPREVFDRIPQRPPFLFVDEVVEVDADRAVTRYTYRPEESFYAGHFPGFPVTPGVVLLETMCQTAFAIATYLLGLESAVDERPATVMMLTDSQVEYSHVVRPGDTVRVTATKVFWRRRKLKADVELYVEGGELAASGAVAGVGVALAPYAGPPTR